MKLGVVPATVIALTTSEPDTGIDNPPAVGHVQIMPDPSVLIANRRSGVAARVGATDQAVAEVVVAVPSAASSGNSDVGVVRVPTAVERNSPSVRTGVVPVAAEAKIPISRIRARSVAAVATSNTAPATVIVAFCNPRA